MNSLQVAAIVEEKFASKITSIRPQGGGCINDNYKIIFRKETVFCKVNSATKFPQLFEKEKHGLEILRSNNCKTPEIIECFEKDELQFLILEWIEPGARSYLFWQRLGEQLGKLHLKNNEHFGFTEDNYMGSVPQVNSSYSRWTDFFINCRLKPMVNRCKHLKMLTSEMEMKLERLFGDFPSLYEQVPPSLLHGDLWSGNVICSATGEPIFIDPAVYYGHPSVDIGMTKLFGGFEKSFYEAYFHFLKQDSNFEDQCELSNLYPLLIHLYLFGKSYLPAIETIVNKYI
jgi:protein-ribulosamine 3-kinase